jgi:arylsulfatase A-like enzyme
MTKPLTRACLATLLPLLACTGDPEDTEPSVSDEWDAARTVVIITTDTMRSSILHGEGRSWNVSPNTQAFFQDAVWFERTITPRGLTAVALSSLLTGAYPRNHGLRANEGGHDLGAATLAERYGENGYTTMSFLANQCQLGGNGFDEQVCGNLRNDGDTGLPDNQQDLDQVANDDLLVTSFLERLQKLPPTEKVFAWVHFNLPHSPYYPISPWIEEFHPEPYHGEVDPTDEHGLYDVALGTLDYSQTDRDWVEAVYASEIRAADASLQALLDGLASVDRYEDAVVVVGADHGEEMADHNDYFYHGCSPYDTVLSVNFAIRAPGRLPQGVHVQAPISLIDIAPTVVELTADFSWGGDQVGVSLVEPIVAGEDPSHDVFFERGVGTAGIVRGWDKYILTPDGAYDDCQPYQFEPEVTYPNEVEELYDISADPGELTNLASSEPTKRSELSEATCAWVRQSEWVPDYQADANPLLSWCDETWPQ